MFVKLIISISKYKRNIFCMLEVNVWGVLRYCEKLNYWWWFCGDVFIDWLRMSVDGGDSKKNVKKISNDFIFGKVIGEGFYLIVSFRCFV